MYTLIMVTHENNVALMAERSVYVLDGIIKEEKININMNEIMELIQKLFHFLFTFIF